MTMKALWWYDESRIAGMARPGLNSTRWFDFTFEEAVLVGWIGQHASGSTSLDDFERHVRSYGHKLLSYYQLDEDLARAPFRIFETPDGVASVLKSLAERSGWLTSYDVLNREIHFAFNPKRLDWEIAQLKQLGISHVVTLTERPHKREILEKHFAIHHFSITDLEPPKLDQVLQFAALIETLRGRGEKMAVHCLAGIGRTSTMIIAAHLALGEKVDDLRQRIAHRNPVFDPSDSQAEFIRTMAEHFSRST